MRLSKRTIDAAKPRSREYVLWDSELTGFGVRIRPTGTKSFIAVYRAGAGRRAEQRKLTIGPVGAKFTSDQARKQAKRFLGAAAAGEDPARERTRKREELLISELCDLYLAEGCTTKKSSTLITDRSRIESHIKPLLGRKRIGEVLRGDIDRLMRDIASGKTSRDERTGARGRSIVSGGRGAAMRTIGLLGGIFSFAIARGLMISNPVVGVKRFPDRKSELFLSDTQLADLGHALTELSAQANPKAIGIIKLLALTGARKSEVVQLRWSEVDFQNRCLRLTQSKTGQKAIPLGPAPLELLNSIHADRGSSDWVFPSKNDKGPFMGLEKVWKRVRTRAGYPSLRIHDLRHSYASMGLARGNALAVIGALLGHSDVKTTARYAHLADDPIRAAADEISRAMADAMSNKPASESEVVELASKRHAYR